MPSLHVLALELAPFTDLRPALSLLIHFCLRHCTGNSEGIFLLRVEVGYRFDHTGQTARFCLGE